MTLERMIEWIEKNYPIDRYDNVYDLIRDVEQRINSDGNDMNPQVKQLLLDEFAQQFDPRYRELLQRRADQQLAADMLGGGQIPKSLADEIIEDLKRPEIMGIDMSQYSTRVETVQPPPVTRFEPTTFVDRVKIWFGKLFRR